MLAKCYCYGMDPACAFCRGRGVFEDSGPPPTGPGILALRPCGCAVDWLGMGAVDDATARRVVQWEAQGFRIELATWEESAPRITAGLECQHGAPAASSRKVLAMVRDAMRALAGL